MRITKRALGVALLAALFASAVRSQEVIPPQPPLVQTWEDVPAPPRLTIREVPEGVTALSWPAHDVVITGGRNRTLVLWTAEGLERLEGKSLPPQEEDTRDLLSVFILQSDLGSREDIDAGLLERDLAFFWIGGEIASAEGEPPDRMLAASTLDSNLLAMGGESGLVAWTSVHAFLHEIEVAERQMEAPVTTLAFRPESRTLLIGTETGTVAHWKGKKIEEFEGHRGAINTLVLDPSGKRLASASSDRTVRIHDVESRRMTLELRGHGSWVSDVTWSPDGRRLLTACYDRVIRLWDATSGQLLHSFTGHGAAVLKVRFSPDGQRFASIGNDDTLRVWEIPEGPQVEVDRGHTKDVFFVTFSPDGKYLASGSGDHSVRIWDVARGTCLRVLRGHSDAVNHVAWSPDGRFIASVSTDGTARLWDAKTGEALAVMRGHRTRLTACDFHPTEPRLATGAGDFTIKEWAVPSGELIRTLRGHLGASKNVVYSPDGRYISSGGGDGSVILWDADTGQVAKKLRAPHSYDHCHSVAFNPQATLMAAGYLGYAVRLFDVEGGTLVTTLEGHTASVEAITLSPDGQTLASASGDRTVRLWDLRSFEEIRRLEGHGMSVYAASWSPDGTMIATCSADRSIKLWQSHTGRLIRSFPATSGAVRSLAPGGVVGTDDGIIRIWPRTRGPLGIRAHRGAVTALAVGEKTVISGGTDGAVRIWDRKSGELIDDLGAELQCIDDLALSADGSWIAACDGGPGILLWSRPDGSLDRVLQDAGVAVRTLSFVAGEPGMIAAGCGDGSLRLWSLENFLRVRLIEPRGGRINAVASRDVKIATASDDGLVRIWSGDSGELTKTLRGHRGPVLDVAYMDDGRIASIGRDQTARIWSHTDEEEGLEVLHLPAAPTALAATGFELAIGATTGDVLIHRGPYASADWLTGLDHGLWVWRKTAYPLSALRRADDGGRVSERDRPGAPAAPMDISELHIVPAPFPSSSIPMTVPGEEDPWDFRSRLSVSAPSSIAIQEAGPGTEILAVVRNDGPDASMLLRVVERNPTPGFLIWPRHSIVRLERGETAQVPLTISHLHLGSGKLEPGGPRSFRTTLDLAVMDGGGHVVPFSIEVQVQAPQPELRDLEVHRDSHGHAAGLGFSLADTGEVDTGSLAVHVEFLRADTRERLGFSGDSDQLYILAPGTKEGPLMFSVPAPLHHVDFPLAFRLFLDADAWPSLSWTSEHEIPKAGR